MRFDAFVAEGRVLNNYANVLAMLQQLRQCCDHPFLVMARPDATGDISKLGLTLLRRWRDRMRSVTPDPAASDGGGSGEASSAFRSRISAFSLEEGRQCLSRSNEKRELV